MFSSKDEEDRFLKVLFPFFQQRQSLVKNQGIRFVHYTGAQTAMSILKNQEFWLRESSCMNDFTEVQHGLKCLFKAYNKDDGTGALKLALNKISAGVASAVESLFNQWKGDFETDTYLTCFSEHDNSEDLHGRLSMWRAYGGESGVAIVIKNEAFFLQSELPIYASPVEYLNDDEFEKKLNLVAKNIISELDFMKKFDPEIIIRSMFIALKFAALCTKHPGFKEEREWRVICSPTMDDVSPYLKKETESIKGVPLIVYKLPLKDKPDIGLVGIEIPRLVDRIIIGPTDYPLAMWKAFVEILENAGVKNPGSKIFVSDIPLRGR